VSSLLLVALLSVQERRASADDDLSASDYRVRMSAALVLGRSADPSAKKDLERALGDAHPSVRAAAAASLGKVGDAASAKALRARLEVETEASVKTQLTRAAETLEAKREKKLFVQVGSVRNSSKAGTSDLTKVAVTAVRLQATKFAEIVEAEDSAASVTAAAKKGRVVRLDGEIRSLSQSRKGGVLSVRAQIEFSVLQLPGKSLKATLSGAATSHDASTSLAALQELAVRGAVESALANAGPSLLSALE
jgi:HEAT repeat protein